MAWILMVLVGGASVFCALAILGAARYVSDRREDTPTAEGVVWPAISVLKPLAGLDEGLEENLRSFFTQDYPGEWEIVLAVREESDPAAAVARRVQASYPGVASRLVIAGDAPYPNRKVRSIDVMVGNARHDLFVMSDSDIRVTPDMLRVVGAEFVHDPELALLTCPYRAVPGASVWSRLEAVMMNTEFLAGILTARLLEGGMRFAVGPTIVCRRAAVEAIGGFGTLGEYLAEDFVFGERVATAGMGVELSRYVVEHRIGTSDFTQNKEHRLRWVRSTRRSRPAGYVGQLFTYPVPLALMLVWVAPWAWPLALAAVILRCVNAWQVSQQILDDPLTRHHSLLILVQDVVSLLYWIAGFAGNTIEWRGKTYYLHPDGRFELVTTR